MEEPAWQRTSTSSTPLSHCSSELPYSQRSSRETCVASADYETASVAYDGDVCLAYCLDTELWKAIDFLKEQVRVLKEQQEKKNKRILLDNRRRTRLAAKAKRLTRELLEATTVLFTPETVLAWHRKLIAQKYDGSRNRRTPGGRRSLQRSLIW